jgi:hypothetical protein
VRLSGNGDLPRRDAEYQARNEALLREFHALDRRRLPAGDPACDAELARLTAALEVLSAEGEALREVRRLEHQRVMRGYRGFVALCVGFLLVVAGLFVLRLRGG